MRLRQGAPRRAAGTSTLEFIIVLPSLLIVMLGAIELSRWWFTANVVVQAAREGARVGTVTDPFVPAPAVARINAVLAGANLVAVAANVACGPPCQPDSQVTATVTVNFQTLFPGLLPMLGGPFPTTATAVMRFE